MPRYFFHAHFDEGITRDSTGLEFPNLNHAIAEADRARFELLTEEAHGQLWLEIMDNSGLVVAKVG